MKKDRPLTEKQVEALRAAEDTLFGDCKIPDDQDGRAVAGLRKRGLAEGVMPHVYLTQEGRHTLYDMI